MTLPLEELPDENSGSTGSTAFMAVIGAIAGGTPQLVIPTATLIELIGNTVMGAVLVAVVDTILVRRTLPPEQLRRGRMLLVFFVAVALTLVTYRTAGQVFQTTFDLAPPLEVQDLKASAYTHERIGNLGFRMTFTVDAVGLKKITDSMETLSDAQVDEFDPKREPFLSYVRRVLPEDADRLAGMTANQGYCWVTTSPNGRHPRTVLLRDTATGKTYVHHLAG